VSTRRTIRKITPSRREYFDAQYWPVLVALVVLSGITAGAVLTLLSGPWMWGSLIALAIAVPVTMMVLEQVGNEKLRRALQLAIVISMSLHMMILVVASLTDIFGKETTKMSKPTKKRPNRVILVSQRTQPRILEQVNKHEVKETEVELEKQTTTDQSRAIEIPVEANPNNSDRQITQSATRSQSVPRFDESLSQLSSSTNSRRQNDTRRTPQTSQQVSTNANPSKSAKPSEATPNDAMAEVKKSSSQAASASAPELSSNPETSAPNIKRTAERRKSEASTPVTESPSQSTSRIRRSTTSMPKTTANSPVKSESTAARSPTETAPRNVMEPVTRREQKSIAERRPLQDLPQPKNVPTEVTKKSIAKKTQPTPAPPSIAQPTTDPVNPRRSRRTAELATSPRSVEAPSPAVARNKTGDSRMQPTASSVTMEKSTAVGSGASKNVSSNSGSLPSTAMRASDTAARRESTSTDSQPSLTSLEKSNMRRSVTNSRQVESALKTNTNLPSKLVGSNNPATRTATSSAATVDSASNAHRAEISAQKGQSQVDIGATKVVTESTAQKRSGGGQPNVANVEMEQVSRERQSTGSRAPSLAANAGAETAAPNQPNSQPASSDSESPAESSVVANRMSGNDSLAGAPTETSRTGPKSDNVTSDLEGLLADNRQRRSRDLSDSASSLEDDDEEEQRGNASTRLAQAPNTGSTTNLGMPQSESGSATGSRSEQNGPTSSEVASQGKGRSNAAPSTGLAQSQAVTTKSETTTGSATRRSTSNREPGGGEVAESESTSNRSSNKGRGLGLSTEAPEIAGGAPVAGQNKTGDQQTATESTVEVDRGNQAGSIELQVAADQGAAGLSVDPSTRVGVKARPATRDSDAIESEIETRFKRNNAGGAPTLSRDAVAAKEAFRGRTSKPSGGGPKTEAAIEMGLEFLARHQQTDGSWTLGGFDQSSELSSQQQLDSDAAATGLALIAFQGAGYNHREYKYAAQLNQAVQWMVANQDSDGCLYVGSNKKSDDVCRMYSHGIAALALTEAYGMTQDPELVKPIEEAIRYIVETQDEEYGGWRYFAAAGNRNTDTSVTGWMLMAMQSARLSGFEVPEKTFDKIEKWLDVAQGIDNESLFRYRPHGKDTEKYDRSEGRRVSPTMTSVGLLMRLYMGWDRSDVRFQRGVDYLSKFPPSDRTMRERDTYYWYYATQVMRHYGGKRWEDWNKALHPMLVESQMQNGPMAGSWHPYLPVPDRWGPAGGRLYVTTMNLLSLEVDYRLLPLYDETSK
jgi:hypothetical protein